MSTVRYMSTIRCLTYRLKLFTSVTVFKVVFKLMTGHTSGPYRDGCFTGCRSNIMCSYENNTL